MKKILTILAAVTGLAAFGIIPEFKQSGTSFESYGDRPFDAAKDDAGSGSDAGRYWYTTDTDASNVLSNYVGDVVNSEPKLTPTGVSRPDYFAPSNNTKFLSVETTGKLYRTIQSNDGNTEFTPYDIPVDGIYLDTLVKFTAADSVFGDDALADGDKIAIEYVEHESEGGDDPTVTNFVIRAGYVGANGVITPTNYFAAVPAGFNKDAWHRLTVRTIAEVGSGENSAGVGFVVYLDQVPLAYSTSVEPGIAAYTAKFNSVVKENFYKNDLHAIYPSAVDAEMTAGRNISAVAFSGNGAIDDVVFTTDRPSFIQESTTVDVVWDEHVATLRLNGQTINVSSGNATTIEPTNGVIDVVVTFATGYRAGAFTADKGGVWEASISCFTGLVAGATCTISSMLPLYEVNGVAFDDLDAAMTAAATGTAQAPATLKLLANCNRVLGFSGEENCYIVLDLNGCNVQGGDDDVCSILNNGITLAITNSGAEASVLLPTNPSEEKFTLLAAAGYTTVQAGTFEGIVAPAENAMTITGGKFLDVDASFDPADPATFYLASFVSGVTCTKSGNYVVVGGGSEPAPVIPTYELTIPSVTGASAEVTSDSVVVADLTAIPSNTEVVVTWTATEGYKITAGETENITMDDDKTATAPTVSAITYATLTITPVENCTIVVSNATEEVATGAKFDEDETVQLTVYRTPAEGYELDNCAATETITMNQDQTVTAAVKQSGGKTYPSYIDDATKQGKYNTWKEAMTAAGVDVGDGEAYEDAYLLNCKPAEVTAEAAAFKFTKIAFEGGVWVTETTTKNNSDADYNGTVVVKQYSDVGCTTESSTGTFFKAFLQ